MKKLADKILHFYSELKISCSLPTGVTVMNPYQNKDVWPFIKVFYEKYYSDESQRVLILGINPGRFGGGVTGIPFTDPIKLEEQCGIENPFQKKPELSADFIYRMIASYGGPNKFYSKFLIGAISPLGFTMNGKNLNYYDLPELQKALGSFINQALADQIGMGVSQNKCYCLGEGKNFKYLKKINEEHQYFEEIIPLAHPRFIMQYKRKMINAYVDEYLSSFTL